MKFEPESRSTTIGCILWIAATFVGPVLTAGMLGRHDLFPDRSHFAALGFCMIISWAASGMIGSGKSGLSLKLMLLSPPLIVLMYFIGCSI